MAQYQELTDLVCQHRGVPQEDAKFIINYVIEQNPVPSSVIKANQDLLKHCYTKMNPSVKQYSAFFEDLFVAIGGQKTHDDIALSLYFVALKLYKENKKLASVVESYKNKEKDNAPSNEEKKQMIEKQQQQAEIKKLREINNKQGKNIIELKEKLHEQTNHLMKLKAEKDIVGDDMEFFKLGFEFARMKYNKMRDNYLEGKKHLDELKAEHIVCRSYSGRLKLQTRIEITSQNLEQKYLDLLNERRKIVDGDFLQAVFNELEEEQRKTLEYLGWFSSGVTTEMRNAFLYEAARLHNSKRLLLIADKLRRKYTKVPSIPSRYGVSPTYLGPRGEMARSSLSQDLECKPIKKILTKYPDDVESVSELIEVELPIEFKEEFPTLEQLKMITNIHGKNVKLSDLSTLGGITSLSKNK